MTEQKVQIEVQNKFVRKSKMRKILHNRNLQNWSHACLASSVTRLGYFWKVLAIKFQSKICPNILLLYASFEKRRSLNETCLGYFWGNVLENLSKFNSDIWSHCWLARKLPLERHYNCHNLWSCNFYYIDHKSL